MNFSEEWAHSPGVDDDFIGADSFITTKIDASEHKIVANLNRADIPAFGGMFSSEDDKTQKEIAHYEKVIPMLLALESSDIDGSYSLGILPPAKKGVAPSRNINKVANMKEAFGILFE